MARSVEFLISPKIRRTGGPMLAALSEAARHAGHKCVESKTYTGQSELLVLYGVGAPDRAPIRARHVESGRRAILWDMGYFTRDRYLRCSIDHDHPQGWLDQTPDTSARWNAHHITLREDHDPNGHIVLVGLGRKSRSYLGLPDWEREKLTELKTRFPGRRIVYRPKPKHPSPTLDCETDDRSKIQDLLRGAALVVCRHSNVAVDAVVAGVPFEAEDGAAMWLAKRYYTRENRVSFLRRLAFWQWMPSEGREAWAFLMGVLEGACA